MGLLRQYFRKGTEFSTVMQAQLNAVGRCLNMCPRRKIRRHRCNERLNPPCQILENAQHSQV